MTLDDIFNDVYYKLVFTSSEHKENYVRRNKNLSEFIIETYMKFINSTENIFER